MGALGSDHFIEAMWQDNEDYLKPHLVNSPVATLIRSGIDEMPELPKVADGTMALISPRPFMLNELHDIGILKALRNDTRLYFSHEVKTVLERHHEAIEVQGVKPGIVNPVSAIKSDGGSYAMFRLLAGYTYATSGASLATDFRIFANSGLKRVGKLISLVNKTNF